MNNPVNWCSIFKNFSWYHIMTIRLHQEIIEVRWGDMDALGHVNNVQYFVYMEQVRVAWLYKTFGNISSTKTGPILANTSCHFIKTLTFPDKLQINLSAAKPGRTSIALHYELFSKSQSAVVAKGESILVWFDFNIQKPIEIPMEIHQQLKE